MISPSVAMFVIFLTPIPAIATWKIHKINRQTAMAERDALPFEPKPTPAALVFLHSLGPIERRYLLQQIKAAGTIFAFVTWFFTFILTLPVVIVPHTDKWFNRSAFIWFQFIRSSSNSALFVSMAVFLCVFLAVVPLRFQVEARYYRTRPISISFLFWTRILSVFLPVLLATAAGIGITMMLLLALHGPVWRNLPAHIPRVLGPDDADLAQDYLNLLATSAPRIFLSIVTTFSLWFTALLALTTVPILRGRVGGSAQTVVLPVKMLLIMVAFPMLIVFAHLGSFHIPSILFVYISLGPPPPYFYAIVPVTLSIAFLALAGTFVKYLEV